MKTIALSALVLLVPAASPAWAYIAAMPTLGKITTDSSHIVVLQVDKVNREKQVIIFKRVADLKGKGAADVVKHKLQGGLHPRQSRTILDWAEPGSIAVSFQNGERTCVTCIGGFWYECAAHQAPWWIMTTGRPELSYAYSGSTRKLRDHVTAMLAGQETLITALKDRVFTRLPGARKGLIERKYEHWDTWEAVGARRLMRGKNWPVCRIKASLKMPNTVHELIMYTDLIIGDGPGRPEDVPALVKALKHQDPLIRIDAAEDLGRIGPLAKDAVGALLQLCKEVDPLIQVEAAKAVASIDPKNQAAVPLLVEVLKHKVGKVRKRAAECLGDLGPDAWSAVADLVKTVKDSDPAVRWAVIDALGQIGAEAAVAVPTLVEALKDASTRGAAVDALGQIGRKAQAAIPSLEKLLKGDDVTVRWATAAALVRIGGPGVKPGVRFLLKTATENRERNWTDAYHILMAPTAREALPVLLDTVRDEALRDFALEIAGDASTYLTKDPLLDVKGFLQDKDAGVRCVAGWVLHCARAVEIKKVIAVQTDTLKASDPWARRQAARFLGRLGPYAKDAVAALSAAREDKDEGVRKAVAEALKNIQK
jgi:HEAT repeat protein